LGGPQYSSPGSARSWRENGQLAGLGVQVVAVQRGGLTAAQAAQRDQPPQRREPVVFYSDEEGDELSQCPDGDRRADAVAAPGLDALVGPDDRVRPHWLFEPDLGEGIAGDEALADGGVQRRPQRGPDAVDGRRGDQCSLPGPLAGEEVEAGLQPLSGQVGEGDPPDAGDEVSVDVVAVAVQGRRAQVRLRLCQPVPQPPRHRPGACRGLVGRAVEDGLACGDCIVPGREPAAPVAGLPAADGGDLYGVVPAAVPRLGQVRAAARELPSGGLVGAAAPLEYDVLLGVHIVPPGERDEPDLDVDLLSSAETWRPRLD
jgi:hypothetical protein